MYPRYSEKQASKCSQALFQNMGRVYQYYTRWNCSTRWWTFSCEKPNSLKLAGLQSELFFNRIPCTILWSLWLGKHHIVFKHFYAIFRHIVDWRWGNQSVRLWPTKYGNCHWKKFKKSTPKHRTCPIGSLQQLTWLLKFNSF